ncbi:Guanine nucleotide-binding protein subunit gamma 3 [Ancistrocladus abbreviatus]
MAAVGGESGVWSSVPSLPPPRPRSPPRYPDLYGKRRETAKLQMLERERGFLEEELKFVESLQPASRCCKEYARFCNSLGR